MSIPKIVEHHDQHPGVTLWEFLASEWIKSKEHGKVPNRDTFPPGWWKRPTDGDTLDAEPQPNAQGHVFAHINHGRWIVDCPGPFCHGSIVADSREPFFICVRCTSPENDYRPYNVIFPRHRARIEAALGWRPDVRTRNWEAAETVPFLLRENRERGVM